MACSSVKFSSPGALSTNGPSDAPDVISLGCLLCAVIRVLPFASGSCVTPPGTLCRRFELTWAGRASPVPVMASTFSLSLVDWFRRQPLDTVLVCDATYSWDVTSVGGSFSKVGTSNLVWIVCRGYLVWSGLGGNGSRLSRITGHRCAFSSHVEQVAATVTS